MDTKKILLITLIVVAILTSVATVPAKDIKDIGFNVSSELKPTNGDGLQFEDSAGNPKSAVFFP